MGRQIGIACRGTLKRIQDRIRDPGDINLNISNNYHYWKQILKDKNGSTEKLYSFLEQTDDNYKSLKKN